MTSISAGQEQVEVSEPSDVAEVRRVSARLAGRTDLNAADMGNLALLATELGSNLLKHAERGCVLVCSLRARERTGIELIALDRGPGIVNLAQAMHDGYSTAGSPGTGLGAVSRLADEFDIYSLPSKGTAVLARLWSREPAVRPAMEFGAVCLPKPGEEVSGDGWVIDDFAGRTVCAIADGLGHGADAAKAARAAIAITQEHGGKAPAEVVERVHGALRSTRGAAFAVGEIDPMKQTVRFCGVGNIAARIIDAAKARHLISFNGTVGQEARKIAEYTYPWSAQSVLVMHSDGLTSRWDCAGYPALIQRHPALIAGVLQRDCARGSDDLAVLAARQSAPAR